MKWKKFDEEKPQDSKHILMRRWCDGVTYASMVVTGLSVKKRYALDSNGREIVCYLCREKSLCTPISGFIEIPFEDSSEFFMNDDMEWMYVQDLFDYQHNS